MLDLHRHDEFSSFDGFGKSSELAKLAKDKGFTALGISNHGSVNGLVHHYNACKENEIKPILGVEAYFQPTFNKEMARYHMCLFAKNLVGYGNLNRLVTLAEDQKYYKPIMLFKDLEKYSEGLICTSACIAGFIPQMIHKGKPEIADKAVRKFKSIFGKDFYIEIQPYKISEAGVQENLNVALIEIAAKHKVKVIMTSDSHYGSKADYDTFKKMHEITGTRYDIKATYGERYMPDYWDLKKRFIKMHKETYGLKEVTNMAKEFYVNLEEIEDKVEENILDKLELVLPQFVEGKDSYKVLVEKIKEGLKKRGKYTKKYLLRCRKEAEIIHGHGYSDYFLIVADYVTWAKDQGIGVGPGRGSVCNSQMAWALGITEVDSLKFDLDFRRFLRADKKKLPDIDLDFETSRRVEVIDYIVRTYKGHAAQICNYGLYKIDNLINDLVKVCGVDDKQEVTRIKTYLKKAIPEGRFKYEEVMNNKECKYFNETYDNIIKHFSKMYLKVRYIGTHAAGVAVTGGKLSDYCALRKTKEKYSTAYDLTGLEQIQVIKFDILGLSTMEQITELRRSTGVSIDESWFDDEAIYKEFGKGNTDGIFQFEKNAVKQMLRDMECDCFDDAVAASAMNRPGPLSEGTPSKYAANKFDSSNIKESKYYEYTKETYGTIVYQEQLQQICINIGKMSWGDSDRVMKILKGSSVTEVNLKKIEKEQGELTASFVKGAIQNGFTKEEATELFTNLLVYTFNKGHAVGYTIISLEEMYYKIYHKIEFWYVKTKFAPNSADRAKYCMNAVKDGILMFLPHVNYTANYSLRKVDGSKVIQEGLISIKGVGEKAVLWIEKEKKARGLFKDYDDFLDRCKMKGSPVNVGVIRVLKEQGALEFSKKTYLTRVTKYNSTLYMKGLNANG